MAITRRAFLGSVAGLCGYALTARAGAAARATAESFLVGRQSADGAWRAQSYAAFRNGDALTPVILWALQPGGGNARGLRWLEKLTDSPEARAAAVYPLFTAGYAAQVFAAAGDLRRAAVWADILETLRIDEKLGWAAHQTACGAWGDSATPPQLPAGVNPPPDMLAPNLSATVLALQGLQAVGRPTKPALPFIESCQNFSAAGPDSFNDGGFFFTPGDPVRNKAGIAGHDPALRFRSYGSATCDGILALRACGLPDDHPRLRAALAWLHANAHGIRHAGAWPRERAAAADSLRFYYAQALAAVSRTFITELEALQAADGSWTGPAPDSCEDEPLLATAFAVRAGRQ